MNKQIDISKLSKDETGKLRGGFSIRPIKVRSAFGASNGNCLGGGWLDTNTNCSGTCDSCSVNVPDKDTDKDPEIH